MVLHQELREDAELVLSEAKVPWLRVIDVHGDAILYESIAHHARTLWLSRQKGTGRLRTRMAEGFPIWPPEHWPGVAD